VSLPAADNHLFQPADQDAAFRRRITMTDETDFRKLAEADSGQSLLAEFWGFLKSNKKWWLGPIVVMLLLLGGLLLLSTTAAAPFIYTLF
jgi:hypothetical protein